MLVNYVLMLIINEKSLPEIEKELEELLGAEDSSRFCLHLGAEMESKKQGTEEYSSSSKTAAGTGTAGQKRLLDAALSSVTTTGKRDRDSGGKREPREVQGDSGSGGGRGGDGASFKRPRGPPGDMGSGGGGGRGQRAPFPPRAPRPPTTTNTTILGQYHIATDEHHGPGCRLLLRGRDDDGSAGRHAANAHGRRRCNAVCRRSRPWRWRPRQRRSRDLWWPRRT